MSAALNVSKKSLKFLGYVAYSVACSHCLVEYVAEVTFLSGRSMLPTLNRSADNVVITEKWIKKYVLIREVLQTTQFFCFYFVDGVVKRNFFVF